VGGNHLLKEISYGLCGCRCTELDWLFLGGVTLTLGGSDRSRSGGLGSSLGLSLKLGLLFRNIGHSSLVPLSFHLLEDALVGLGSRLLCNLPYLSLVDT
jgi:hypothetical protein